MNNNTGHNITVSMYINKNMHIQIRRSPVPLQVTVMQHINEKRKQIKYKCYSISYPNNISQLRFFVVIMHFNI